MQKLTGGQIAVRSLQENGVDTLFGLPGIQNDWLYNALYDAPDIRVIHTRHEQGAAYMALGYALATGNVGVYNVVPGPGFLNSTAALSTAYALNAKVLCLCGQIPSKTIGKKTGVLHEIPDQLGIMESLTKWSKRATNASQVAQCISEAFQQLHSNRPRPVGVEIPMDILASQTETTDSDFKHLPVSYPLAQISQVDDVAKYLTHSKNPLIFVGSGAQGCAQEIQKIAEVLQAPVVGYRTGRGILDSRHYLSLTLPAAHELWKSADVVLGVGTNMRIPIQKWGTDEKLKIIRIDVDEESHNIIHTPDIAITARGEDILPQLFAKISTHKAESRKPQMLNLHKAWQEKISYLEPQLSYLKVIRNILGEEGIFVDELTQIGFTSRIVMPVYKPRTFISTGYQGTLGYGFPTAMGVKVAKPDIPVISVTGDGGFMFAVQELATAVQHRIGVIVLLFNNNQYGNVQQMQRNLYGNKIIASDLHNPDFVAMAKSFGANAFRINSPEELEEICTKICSDLPTVIEIPVGDMPSIDYFRKLPRTRGAKNS
ncbi:thiamine pyrophosphate-dependent enzyme [Candidatus Uabimicrobium sp. HlEnr_7]|uniref:thiamine pyrophosphate-dependent enzyme n=1 Tax=Candidatus Uabimicrobium helgolandensis TaxID=3095367 RepID=UPI0035588DFC